MDVTRVTDPASGREIAVQSGSSYHWMDYRDNIVGTDTYLVIGPYGFLVCDVFGFRPVKFRDNLLGSVASLQRARSGRLDG